MGHGTGFWETRHNVQRQPVGEVLGTREGCSAKLLHLNRTFIAELLMHFQLGVHYILLFIAKEPPDSGQSTDLPVAINKLNSTFIRLSLAD